MTPPVSQGKVNLASHCSPSCLIRVTRRWHPHACMRQMEKATCHHRRGHARWCVSVHLTQLASAAPQKATTHRASEQFPTLIPLNTFYYLLKTNRQQKTNQLSQHQQVPEGATDLKSWGCSRGRLTILTLFWGRIIHISKVTLNASSLTREAFVIMNSSVWDDNYLGSEKEELAVGFFAWEFGCISRWVNKSQTNFTY